MSVISDKLQNTLFTLWDIDREFQNAYEAYEQYQVRRRLKRSVWVCLGTKHHDDALGNALSLGRRVQQIMEIGVKTFGARFEQGDSMFPVFQ
jgi:hypothetical protein